MEGRSWVDAYTRELNKEKRAEILEQAIGEEGLSPENELRKKILEARYGKSKERDIDYFVRGWMQLHYLRESRLRLFARRGLAKDRDSIRSDFQLALADSYGEAGKRVFYEEFTNLARVFLELCRTDSNYSSVIFGMGKMKEKSLSTKIAKDFYNIAVRAPEELGMEEELAEFRRALIDVFCEEYPEQKEVFTDSGKSV